MGLKKKTKLSMVEMAGMWLFQMQMREELVHQSGKAILAAVSRISSG
jgi:hypothetical protein